MSPEAYMVKDKIYVIYNDNSENAAYQGNSGSKFREKIYKNGKLAKMDGVLKIVSSDGSVNGMTLLQGKTSEESLYPHRTKRLNQTQLYFYAANKKKQRFGILSLDKLNYSISTKTSASNFEESENPNPSSKNILERMDIKDAENPSNEILDKIKKMKESADRELQELSK